MEIITNPTLSVIVDHTVVCRTVVQIPCGTYLRTYQQVGQAVVPKEWIEGQVTSILTRKQQSIAAKNANREFEP